jgi:AbrB family looped-hinge helix DNA binding protein
MTAKLTIDKAGRVVLPKPLREELRLSAGDTLSAEVEGDRILLQPVRPKIALRKKSGIWVYHGERSTESIPELIDREREKRIRELSE